MDAYIENGEERYKPSRKLARNFIVAAIDAARKPIGDDAIMRQHLNEGGTPT